MLRSIISAFWQPEIANLRKLEGAKTTTSSAETDERTDTGDPATGKRGPSAIQDNIGPIVEVTKTRVGTPKLVVAKSPLAVGLAVFPSLRTEAAAVCGVCTVILHKLV